MLAFIIIPLSGFAVDIYVPSLPIVAKFFGKSASLTQITVTIFLISYGLSQFIAGKFIDIYGRRRPTIITLLIFAMFSFSIPFVTSIYQLILLRFAQGFCVGVFVTAKRAVFIDIYTKDEVKKVLPWVTIAWSIGPIVAPAIGGYLQHYFNWQANFYFLGIYATLVALAEYIFIAETLKVRSLLSLPDVITTYKTLFSNMEFVSSIINNGLLYSMVILFGLVGSFFIQTKLNFTPVEFGKVALGLGFAWLLGGLSNRILLNYNMQNKIKFGLIAIVVIALIMILLGFKFMNIYVIVIPAFLIHFMAGFCFNNYFSYAMTIFPQYAATASGVLGSITYIVTSFSSSFFGAVLPRTSQIPIAIGYLIICLGVWLIFYLQLKYKNSANSAFN